MLMNTKTNGEINFIIFKDKKDDSYTAVCLDFDIVEQGSDPSALRLSIEEAARMHLETVREFNLDEKLLNRHAPKSYWDRARVAVAAYEESLERDTRKSYTGNHKKSSLRDIWMRNPQELLPA